MLKYTISLDLLIKYDFIDETLNKVKIEDGKMKIIIEADNFDLSKSFTTELLIPCGFEWCRKHPCKQTYNSLQ